MEIDPEALSRPDSHALTSASQRQRDVNLRKNHRPIQSRDRQVRCGVATESDIRDVSQKRQRSSTVVSVALMAVAILLADCDGKRAADAPPAAVVTVSKPLQKKITEWDEYTGRFGAVATVEVRPRVSGFIESIHFKDGDIVKQNDLLFTIDQRPYQFAVSQARADLQRAQAKLELADLDYQRALPLLGNQTMTQREFDTRRSTQKDAAASVDSAEAILQQAQLNLEWTEVRAPIAGRISDRRVDAGNLVVGGSGGASLLTTIVSVDPIYFIFDGSEADFLHYLRLAAAGVRPSSRDAPNPVAVRLSDEDDFKHEGHMDFVDNAISIKTGTMRARAIFPNADGLLTPGFFGRLRLFGGEHESLLVPDSAIASDQSNKIVYVIVDDGTVGVKRVELGPMVDGLRAIRTGLESSDTVVIEGLARVRPGQKVRTESRSIQAAVR
jgi:multidrug efflux system membrane fusion protein